MEAETNELTPAPKVNVRNSIARRGGRPSKFELDMVPKIRKAAKAGMTELEIADLLEVDSTTLKEWQIRYPRLTAAMELGYKQAIKRVKRSLYHRSVGYSFDSEKIFNDKGTIVRAQTREHIPPDINAIKFWLTNRDPENWQDKTGVDIQGSINLVAQTLSTAKQRVLQAKSSPPTLEADMDSQVRPDEDQE